MTGRTYGGESADERSARRRQQFLSAGLELFGTIGYGATGVRSVCRTAGLTDRYFYEQFDNLEALLLAVYEDCTDRLALAVDPGADVVDDDLATEITAGLDRFLATVEGDHRLARVVWFEVLGVSERIEAASLARMRRFGDQLIELLAERGAATVGAPGSTSTLRILADAAVGGVSQVVMAWCAAGFDRDRIELVDALTRFLEAVAVASDQPI